MTITKSLGPAITAVSATSSTAVAGLSFLEKLDKFAAAYGLIFSASGIILGLVITFIFNVIKVIDRRRANYLELEEQRRFNDLTLENQREILSNSPELKK